MWGTLPAASSLVLRVLRKATRNESIIQLNEYFVKTDISEQATHDFDPMGCRQSVVLCLWPIRSRMQSPFISL